MLVELGRQQNYRIWGNDLDMSQQSHALGYLMWLQYHCCLVVSRTWQFLVGFLLVCVCVVFLCLHPRNLTFRY